MSTQSTPTQAILCPLLSHLERTTGVLLHCCLQVIHNVADKHGYGCVKEFVGHGVGRHFHSAPMVQHNRNNSRDKMVVGQTFTIEPQLNEGSIKGKMWKDGWTVVTSDGRLSAQYEHTILITQDGHEILTLV